jgi:hypothetical protein
VLQLYAGMLGSWLNSSAKLWLKNMQSNMCFSYWSKLYLYCFVPYLDVSLGFLFSLLGFRFFILHLYFAELLLYLGISVC